MRKIIDYKIVRCIAPQLLQESVNRQIKEGWQPHGYFLKLQNDCYCQAMVKYEEDKNDCDHVWTSTNELVPGTTSEFYGRCIHCGISPGITK